MKVYTLTSTIFVKKTMTRPRRCLGIFNSSLAERLSYSPNSRHFPSYFDFDSSKADCFCALNVAFRSEIRRMDNNSHNFILYTCEIFTGVIPFSRLGGFCAAESWLGADVKKEGSLK